MPPRHPRRHFDASQLRITRGALILLVAQVGMSLVWLMSDKAAQHTLAKWFLATPNAVWREWKLWTLLTAPLLEINFISLLFTAAVLWLFVPGLERWWGTARFLRFAAMTSIAGTIAGTLAGLALGWEGKPIVGFDPFVYASVVAFGIVYARQPVQFFGVLPLTGRQLMYGFLGFCTLFVVLNRAWADGAADLAAIGLGAVLVSERWSPQLAWRRWRQRRARRHLDVMTGGKRKDRYVN